MILILNMGKKGIDESLMGEHIYELKINDKNICYFTHKRSDGLANCLIAAAEAVKKIGGNK